MQTYENNVLKDTSTGDFAELQEKQAELMSQLDNAHSTIGSLPEKKDEFELRGLCYVVTFVDKQRGIFHAKLKRPEK